jgi:hypothetical protein
VRENHSNEELDMPMTLCRDPEDRRRCADRSDRCTGSEYGGYGYRRITALLQRTGWYVGKDRAQRIWHREGLKVPQKQRPRRRLSLNDGSCIRLRPERGNHVWSYDFVSGMTHDGRILRMTPTDEYTRECLAIRAARRLGSYEVIEALADVMVFRGNARKYSRGQWSGVRGEKTTVRDKKNRK